MQEKEQKISPIKTRILQFIENLGCSKREFYKKIGVSRGTLESKTGITEDILAKFISIYPEVNLEWLINGVGEVFKSNMQEKEQKTDDDIKFITLLDKFQQQAIEIGQLRQHIKYLEQRLGKDAASVSTAITANVG